MLVRFLHNTPIRGKLAVISLLTAGAALLPTIIVWQVHERSMERANMLRDISSTALVLGQTSIPALSRGDGGSAQQTMQSLSADSRIIAGALYSADGKPFAAYHRSDAKAGLLPPAAEQEGHRFGADRMDLFSTIRVAGQNAGAVYIQTDLAELNGHLRDALLLSLLSIGVAALAAYFLARKLHRVITGPVRNLMQLMSTVSVSKDYSVRAVKHGEDELGSLVDRFNAMLEQIQGHELELQAANGTLEHRIEERTGELQLEFLKLGQAREALAESQERLSLTVRYSGIGIWNWEIAPNMVTADENCSILFGQPLGQFPRTVEGFAAMVHPDDRGRVQNEVATCVKLGEDYNTQYRVVWSEGTIRNLAVRAKIYSGKNGEQRRLTGVCWDVTERRQAEDRLHAANDKLTRSLGELERRKSQNVIFSEMFDLLQACPNSTESYGIVAQFCAHLFPTYAGAVYIYNASRNLVASVATWNDPSATETTFEPEDCWALRRGHLHITEPGQFSTPCRHVKNNAGVGHACFPLMAQGTGLGLLYLQHKRREGAPALEEFLPPEDRQLAAAVAEHIALSFANIRLQEALRHQTIRDPLTGLFNRRYLEESVEREIHRTARRNQPAGFAMMDLDHFKNFNDTFGHEGGDAVLRAFGEFLKGHLRQEDIACRYGGEEFCILFCEASLEDTSRRAEQIRSGVKQLTVQLDGRSLGVITISIGVAGYPTHASTLAGLIAAADRALYQAKAEGRDRVITATAPTP